jgi:next-to-BRCA1 protein 1
MRVKKFILAIIVASLTVFSLSACSAATPTEDPVLKITQVASTVLAQLTQSAALTPSATATLEPTATQIPPTNTPSEPIEAPTNTPNAGSNSSGDKSVFVGETVPDGTTFGYNTEFTKTWKFKNLGTTTWTTDYSLVMIDGTYFPPQNLHTIYLPKSVAPGETVEISVDFVSPITPGTYYSMWKLANAAGITFGEYCSIKINAAVMPATVAPTKAATSTGPTPKP